MMKKISLILLASAVAFGSAFAENFKYGNFGGSIEASKKAGYDGVQFWLGRKDQDDKGGYSKQSLENMKATLKKNGMLACGICVGCYHQFLFEEDKNVVEYMKNVVDNAAELGADNILIPFFGKSSLYKNGNELRYERLFPLVQKLKEIAPYAAKKGVNLALETTLLAKDEIRLLDMINEPNVKIYFDTLNTAWAGENPADALRLLGKDRIAQIHIKADSEFFDQAKRPNLDECFKAILDIKYDGWIVHEQVNPPKKNPYNEVIERNLKLFKNSVLEKK